MPQLTRNWYFEPDRVPPGPAGPAAMTTRRRGWPRAVRLLQRHGARVLDPSDAPTIPRARQQGWARTPRSTVYRARTLLIPADLLADASVVARHQRRARPRGDEASFPRTGSAAVRGGGRAAEVLRRLPRVAVLAPAAEPGKPPLPVTVDAWTALQALARGRQRGGQGADRPRRSPRRSSAGSRLSISWSASAITGSPSTEGNGVSGSPSTEGNGLTGPGSTAIPTPTAAATREHRSRSACPRPPAGPGGVRLPAAGRRGPRHRGPRPPVAGRAARPGGPLRHHRPFRRLRRRRLGHPGRHHGRAANRPPRSATPRACRSGAPGTRRSPAIRCSAS